MELITSILGNDPGEHRQQEGTMTRRFWVKSSVAAALATALVLPGALRAADVPKPIRFLALATGPEETPPVNTPATATGTFILTTDRKKLIYDVKVSGLSGDPTAMHLHLAPRGTPGAVVVPLDTPAGGEASNCVDNIAPDIATALMSGGLYLNIHTAQNKAGEVRGQVVPAP
jgi:hypothetical protein